MNTYPNDCKSTIKKWNTQIICENNAKKEGFSIKKLLRRSHLTLESALSIDGKCHLYSHSSDAYGVCPHCGKRSYQVHSLYNRRLMDLPLMTESVELHLTVRRFFCRNRACNHVTFAEQPGDEIVRYQRKTKRCIDRQLMLSSSVSSIVAQKELYYCQIPMSSSTILRRLHKQQIPATPDVRFVGVDDWAYRKGMTYGSILIDLGTKRFIDLLENRDKEPFAKWLRNHPSVQVVSRDRSTAYSAAVADVNCFIEEVADRFHLVKNMSDHFVEIIKAHYDDCQRAVREERLAILKENNKVVVKSDGEQTDLDFYHNKVVYDYFVNREKMSDIYKKLKAQGASFDRSEFMTRFQYIRKIRRKCVTIKGDAASYPNIPLYQPQIIGLIASKEMKGILLSKEEKLLLNVLHKRKWFSETYEAVKRFNETIHGSDSSKVEDWINRYTLSKIRGLQVFANGLKRDLDAVKNAVTKTDISNGMVEGYNNKLKAIKRIMYGRASIHLLAVKMYLSERLHLHEK